LIGNEILSGKVKDTNGPLLTRRLRSAGVELRRIITVTDEIEEIVWALLNVAADHDYVFTSGGIGPTHDDVTIDAVATAYHVSVIQEPTLVDIIRRRKGAALTTAHLRMARVPEGTVLIPGGATYLPLLRFNNVFILPGLPEVFAEKIEVLVPLISGATVECIWLYTTMDEGHLANHLEEVLAEYPEVTIGSYPVMGRNDYRVRVSIESRNAESAEAAAESLRRRLPPLALVHPDSP